LIDGTALEIQIGNWVINQGLQQLDDWHKQGMKLEVSVNISSHHLLSPTFIAEFDKALARYPAVQANCLQLEILESSALGDLQAISTIIKTCQDNYGVSIALDDFGTGYSSLTHLRNLSANTIKIDKSFVLNMLKDADDYAIINGVIGLANAFNRKVIAEGVETIEHGLMLLEMGCEQAQGYGIARPMPAENILTWLDDNKANDEWLACGNEVLASKSAANR
jgi:EAL domain-containing protein (putative c-di-GMP-specific phosphodiesterase class I)